MVSALAPSLLRSGKLSGLSRNAPPRAEFLGAIDLGGALSENIVGWSGPASLGPPPFRGLSKNAEAVRDDEDAGPVPTIRDGGADPALG